MPTNKQRGHYAYTALIAYQAEHDCEDADAPKELIAGLLHFYGPEIVDRAIMLGRDDYETQLVEGE